MEYLDILDLIRLVALFENGYTDFEKLLEKCDNSNGQKLLKLWQHIHSCKGKYADTKEDRIQAYKVIYGKNALYKAKKMHSSLTQLRFFLIVFGKVVLTNELALEQFMQALIFRKLGHEKLEYDALDLAIAQTQGQMTPAARLIDFFANRRKYLIEEQSAKASNVNLIEIEKAFDRFYVENKLQNAIEIVSKCRCTGQPFDTTYIAELKRFLNFLPDQISPLVEVQTHVIQYHLAPSEEAYKGLKKAYFSQYAALGAEKGGLLIDLISSLTVIPNLSIELRSEYLELYKFGLSNNHLVEEGKISSLRYDNIIFCAEFIGDFAFIKQVVEELGDLIADKKDKKRSLLLSTSYMFFGEEKYDEAIEKLRILGRTKKVPHYFIQRKHLLVIKCLYERSKGKIDAYIDISNERDSFFKMLNRYRGASMDEATFGLYINFFNFARELSNPSNANNIEYLKSLLAKTEKHIMELKWLEEKLAELDRRNSAN